MPLSNILILFLLLVSPALLISAEPQFPCFFIFGDSMVDNGNSNNLKTKANSNYLPYGIDFPAGPTGRFTNGRNIADLLAELLGFDKPIPPFSNSTNEDILKGLNYASSGAGILDESGSYYGDVVTLKKQLSNHKKTIAKTANLLDSKIKAREHVGSCIYYIGLGNNDYLLNYLPKFYSGAIHYTPKQFAAHLAIKYSRHLNKLYAYGARKIAVFGAGRLGCMPQQVAAFGATNGSYCYEPTNEIVGLFNNNLQILINDLNNRLPEAKFLFAKDYSDDPEYSYGAMTVLDKACCATSAERKGHCVVGGETCSNRDDYYFWDEYHPTEAANKISAFIAYVNMAPLFPDTSIDAL